MASTLFDGFYDAKTAREISVGERAATGNVGLTEINALQVAVDTACSNNSLRVEVINSTTMTQSLVYFEAWNDPQTYNSDAHNTARARMDRVIAYFSRLGFRIKRDRDGVADRIKWIIRW